MEPLIALDAWSARIFYATNAGCAIIRHFEIVRSLLDPVG
jgi:hypothetical protein